MRIADKTLLVTGANRGIGRALVQEAHINGRVRSPITTGEGQPIGGTP